ncbi:uncharacterized protein LOC127867555 [Dreissena polymorpha]|uniref:Serotonin N-acetyltransferase n=1 Tax=Dreissena polymorpha TaxID=45954 RepID=A0A9D4LYG9_DREPO|nr:uncharacterized protein LOC127867555 [Dreissena polymorpha]KAH3867485.1 hypothetical protein DPMN_030613 [Dreissena polymorpha]
MMELTADEAERLQFINTLVLRDVSAEELNRIFTLESDSYPDDEAASYKMLVYRHTEAPDLMLGCFLDGDLLGFICATRYHGKRLATEAMRMHIPNGESVCIHSVVVRKDQRRQGIALLMLRSFVERVRREQRDVARVLLICKSNLIPLYTRAGFVLNGRSDVVHGKDPWYEFQIDVSNG